jgi:hypothetical protein
VTLKPSLVGSKLRTMASFKDAMVGVRSHGVVTGAEDRGVFVSFFGGLSGTAGHACELLWGPLRYCWACRCAQRPETGEAWLR